VNRLLTTADLPASMRPDPIRDAVRSAIAREGLALVGPAACNHNLDAGQSTCPDCILDAARNVVLAATP
jgi:hypothetical protein